MNRPSNMVYLFNKIIRDSTSRQNDALRALIEKWAWGEELCRLLDQPRRLENTVQEEIQDEEHKAAPHEEHQENNKKIKIQTTKRRTRRTTEP